MNRMTVALFPNHASAEPARKRLTDGGIHAESHDELRLAKLWFVSKHESGVRLEVPADEFERAENILQEHETELATRDAIRCPECASFRIQYPQATQKSMLTNLFMGLAAEVRLVERLYYCEECHCNWPHHPVPHKPRLHSAPYYFIEGVEPKRGDLRDPR
jgi:hypothetical protein